MKKRLRISLLVLVMALVALVIAVPAFGKEGSDKCVITFPHTHPNLEDEFTRDIQIEGVLKKSYIDGGIENQCKGNIPLGDAINSQMSWATFEDLCSPALPGECEKGVYTLTNEDQESINHVLDPDSNRVYWSDIYEFTVREVNGNFTFTKTYYFEE
jgi:hypothetical protein